nr:uncharacterized protein LOC131778552 [Pocillopora verrucosa]
MYVSLGSRSLDDPLLSPVLLLRKQREVTSQVVLQLHTTRLYISSKCKSSTVNLCVLMGCNPWGGVMPGGWRCLAEIDNDFFENCSNGGIVWDVFRNEEFQGDLLMY